MHLVVSVPPSIALSNLIGQIKGSSSHFVNHELGLHEKLIWQSSFGVLSLSERSVPRVVEYVRQQKVHHRDSDTIAGLERVAEE